MKAFISILLICGFIIIDGVKAQDNYTTTNGLIVITATIDDKPVIYASDELQATLNYQTAEIEFELDKNNLRADDDFILQLFNPSILRFTGKLGIDYIRTERHPVQKFLVGGTLSSSSDNQFDIHGLGTLSHLYSQSGNSWLLNLSFHMAHDEVAKLLLAAPPPGVIHMEIIQTLLDHSGY
jgi:hypothetical protein